MLHRKLYPRLLDFALLGGLSLSLIFGIAAYAVQSRQGLAVTGMSQRIPWGLYISQFTFLVGIAASSVILLVPYYIHRQQHFGQLIILGETVSVIALIEAMLFILVDLGRPSRLVGLLLHPSLSSLMVWDLLVLGGYLALCATILAISVLTKRNSPPPWLRGLVLLSIPWACAIHVVTALLYSGLSARPGWMSAVMAPKFLSTAFASGAALLLLLAALLTRARRFNVGQPALLGLATVMAYAVSASLLFTGLEVFTICYANLPEVGEHLEQLYVPQGSPAGSGVWMLIATFLLASALPVLLVSRWRQQPRLLSIASGAVFASVFIEKGCWLIPAGFMPTSLGYPAGYQPSIVELLIVAGIHAGGILTFLTACWAYLGCRHRASATDPHASNERFRDRSIVRVDPRHVVSP